MTPIETDEKNGPPEVAPPLPKGLPDGWLFDHDLPCPTCEYNLRMLRVPRCPECGTAFRWQALLHVACPRCNEPLLEVDGSACPRCALALDWRALLGQADPAQLRQYEYAPRPLKAAMRVWFAALVPARFWARQRLEAPPVVSRLRRFRFYMLALFAVGFICLMLPAGLRLSSRQMWEEAVLGLSAALTLPLATILLLPRFTPTLARFRVRPDQLLRCLSYGCAGVGWIGVFYLLAGAGAAALDLATGGASGVQAQFSLVLNRLARGLRTSRGTSLELGVSVALSAALLALAFGWWWRFLYLALRNYLRLDQRNALALFFSTQIIGVALMLNFVSRLPSFQWFIARVFFAPRW